MNSSEYSIKEMRQFMDMTQSLYDIVRLIDPMECREIYIEGDALRYGEECYEVWDSEHRCKNCSSYKACMSGHRREKNELFAGKVYHVMSSPVKLHLDEGTVLPCVIEFITSRTASGDDKKSVNNRLAEEYDSSSLHDPLTGLYNWDGFHQEARRLFVKYPDKEMLLIVCDIAEFRLINSLFGREKGNEILLAVAGNVKPYIGDDIIVGRLQADQFALCLPKDRFREESLLSGIEAVKKLLDDSAFHLQIHAGIYETSHSHTPVSVMYDRAQMALMSIRDDASKVIAWFDDEMLANLLYRQELVSGFEKTLASGEYQIFIQPQVDSDGRVLGGEALARWIRPDGEIVPPFKFIPILEEAGLIARLDRHVWELAARQLCEWEGTEFDGLHISVNISALDFYYIDVYGTLTELVQRYGIDRSRLKLEITETAIMEDAEKQILKVQDLRSYGFDLEIDDFGTGYSSLSMLKDIEADVLKIDMAFLRETKNVDRSRHVLRSIIEMAKRLGMTTITEGVEYPEQVEMLKEMGCNMYQGFYFAKPMPVGEFEQFAREHSL